MHPGIPHWTFRLKTREKGTSFGNVFCFLIFFFSCVSCVSSFSHLDRQAKKQTSENFVNFVMLVFYFESFIMIIFMSCRSYGVILPRHHPSFAHAIVCNVLIDMLLKMFCSFSPPSCPSWILKKNYDNKEMKTKKRVNFTCYFVLYFPANLIFLFKQNLANRRLFF